MIAYSHYNLFHFFCSKDTLLRLGTKDIMNNYQTKDIMNNYQTKSLINEFGKIKFKLSDKEENTDIDGGLVTMKLL